MVKFELLLDLLLFQALNFLFGKAACLKDLWNALLLQAIGGLDTEACWTLIDEAAAYHFADAVGGCHLSKPKIFDLAVVRATQVNSVEVVTAGVGVCEFFSAEVANIRSLSCVLASVADQVVTLCIGFLTYVRVNRIFGRIRAVDDRNQLGLAIDHHAAFVLAVVNLCIHKVGII